MGQPQFKGDSVSQVITLGSGGSLPPTVPTSFVTDAGTAIPALNILNVLGGTNIGTTGAGNTITINLDGTTIHTVQLGTGGLGLTSLANGTTGQILTAVTGADPQWAAPAASSISITGDSGGALTSNAFTFTGGTTGLTFSGAGTTETLTGTLAIANGGTNATSFATTDGTVYFDGTRLVTTATGTANFVLTSNGAGVAPTYQTVSASGAVTSVSAGTNISITGTATAPIVNVAGTTIHTVQLGTGATGLTSLANGTTGQVLKAVTGLDPAWAQVVLTTDVTGVLPIANGGTNASSMSVTDGTVYFDGTRLVTTATGTSGQFLKSQGAGVAPIYATLPASSISITGDSGGALTGAAFTFTGGTTGLTFAGAGTTETLGGDLVVANGGTGKTTFTAYSVITAGTTATGPFQNVSGVGTAGQVLTSNGAAALPTWQAASGGTITSVVTANATNQFVLGGTTETIDYKSDVTNNNLVIGSSLPSFTGGVDPTHATGLGYNVLNALTSGTESTAVGYNAMALATSAVQCTAIGSYTLQAITSSASQDSVAVGCAALYRATTSVQNTAVGSFSMNGVTSGSGQNTALGYYSLGTISTGTRNVALGSVALQNVASGGNNIGIGYNVGSSLSTGSSNVYIQNAGANESNTIRIGTTGTSTAQQNLCYIAGAVTFGDSAATETHALANGSGVKTVTLGSTNSTSTTTVQSGSGVLNITSTNGAMTINSGTGALGISTDSSATTVSLATGAAVKGVTLGSTNSTSATTVQSGSGALNITSTNGAITMNSGTGTVGIGTDATAATYNFATGAAVKAVTIGSATSTSSTAIKFGGSTGSTLDTYITGGTFTPAVTFGGASTGVTYGTQTGHYTRIGNIVTFRCQVILTNKGSSTGTANITNLPYAVATASSFVVSPSVLTLPAGYLSVTGIVLSGGTIIYLQAYNLTGSTSNLDNTAFANTTNIIVSGSYLV